VIETARTGWKRRDPREIAVLVHYASLVVAFVVLLVLNRNHWFIADEWSALYRECWRTFYGFENMRAILSRVPPENYWPVFRNFIWNKNAAEIEGEHPMITGFWRIKDRLTRRPGFPIPGRWTHFVGQVREKARQIRQWVALLLEMEELWLQTRRPGDAEQRIIEELNKICAAARGQLKLADLQLAHFRAKMHFPTLRVPSKLDLFWAKWYPLLASRTVYTRADLDSFWDTVKERWNRRQWFLIPPHRFVLNLFRDVQISLMFFIHLRRAT